MTEHHEECLLKLSAHLDDELSAEDQKLLQEELALNPGLENEASVWAVYRQELSDSSRISIPNKAATLAKIQSRIREGDSAVNPVISLPRRWMAAAAALLLLLSGILWMGTPQHTLAEPEMWVETHVPDSSAVVYEDKDTGVTVIWMVTDNDEMQDG